jgi:hypothetical protein
MGFVFDIELKELMGVDDTQKVRKDVKDVRFS